MSNEIQLSMTLNCNNGNYSETFKVNSLSINQNALGASSGILSVPTSTTAIPVGSVATLGVLALRNLDATNFVTIGVTSGSYIPILKLKPGEAAIVRLQTGITIQAKSDTATTLLNYLLLND